MILCNSTSEKAYALEPVCIRVVVVVRMESHWPAVNSGPQWQGCKLWDGVIDDYVIADLATVTRCNCLNNEIFHIHLPKTNETIV